MFVRTGQAFPLGIPLTDDDHAVRGDGGLPFPLSPVALRRMPAVGVRPLPPTQELSSFNDAGEDVAASHVGFIVLGGVEVRVHDGSASASTPQYTHVTGILGTAGHLEGFGETIWAARPLRVKVLVGR